MYKRTKVCSAVLLALGGTAGLSSAPAFAQTTTLERVEITGSSVRRIDAETALPVTVIKREQIEKSGATTTTDLLQKLPGIQGGFGESGGVGGTGGYNSVSIHNVGDTRTLVLLNGHRLAAWGGQLLSGFGSGIDLNSIPVSAIERVEILTDGASALYGSDAIAGVVNFITRRNVDTGDFTLGYSSPKGGAKEKRISATKGIGTIETDGFNVMLTVSHDERTKLDAKDRNFGKTGKIFFSLDGVNYRKQQFSARPIPANVLDDAGNLISPYQKTTGVCPDKTFRVIDGTDDYCGFDFVGELEIYPIRKRDTLMTTGNLKIGDQELFADVLYAKTRQIGRIAPVPGGIDIAAGSPLFTQYLTPIGITQDTTAFYRLYDLGKRENQDDGKFIDLAVGSKGMLFGWDYTAGFTHSQSDNKTSLSGYPGALAVGRLTSSGALNPFVGPGQQSAAGLAAINAANYKGYWDGGTSKLDTLFLRGSSEIATLPAGPLLLGVGVNYNIEKFQSKPSLFAQGLLADPVAGTLCDEAATPAIPCDTRFGDEAFTKPYGANRKSAGLFGELVIPVVKDFEVTTSLRIDKYSVIGNATTAKGAFRWTPTKELLLRGSIGTGFRAPTVPQINATIQPFGVTSDPYTCTPELAQVAAAQGAVCQPGNLQYDVLAGGNLALKPEKSKQATLGLRFEPDNTVSVGADLWHVQLKDQIGQLSQSDVFENPLKYPGVWSSKRDTGTGTNYLAFFAGNRNLGNFYSTGIDFDLTGRFKIAEAELTSNLALTYMIRESQQLAPGGPYYSAIGNFAELDTVTFRWQGKLTNTLKVGSWAHTLALNLKSGYTDKATSADVLDSAGNAVGAATLRLAVARYYTFDFQTQWAPFKSVSLTAGVLNLFDTAPPLAISTGGNNRGQQFGFDDRYYDSRGRTLYVNGSYKF
jgi:iron complex outermembrane recepter protein